MRLPSAALAYAVTSGMVATVNPCGFAMLPAYVSYQLGAQEQEYETLAPAWRALPALGLGVVVTVGFIVRFAAVGIVVSLHLGARAFRRRSPTGRAPPSTYPSPFR